MQKAIGKYIQVVLFKLGFDPRVNALPDGVQHAVRAELAPPASRPGSRSGSQEYPAPSELLDGLLGCDAFVPDSDSSPNISGFCDRETVQPLMERAVALGLTRPQAAERLWRQVDRRVVDLAVWLPLFNPKHVDLVSARVGNYRWSPQLRLMPSRLWVQLGGGVSDAARGAGQARRADGAAPGHGALDEHERRRAAVHAAARRPDGRPARGAQGAQGGDGTARRSPT